MHHPVPTRARLVALIAVVLVALVGGSATAATVITSKMIKNDTIKPVDLNFVLGQRAAVLSTPTPIIGPDYVSVLTDQMVVDDGGGTATAQADVQLSNATLKPITVTVRLAHVQDSNHTSSFVTVVPAGSTVSAPAGLLCDGFPAGKQTVELSVNGDGITVDHALLTMIATP